MKSRRLFLKLANNFLGKEYFQNVKQNQLSLSREAYGEHSNVFLDRLHFVYILQLMQTLNILEYL